MTLARSPISRTGTLKRKTPMKRAAAPMKRSAAKMKSSKPKMTPARRAAKGEDCTLRIPGVCNSNSETVVLCHSNRLEHGKGMGLKAPDAAACFGCSDCHDVLDGRRPMPSWLTYEALQHGFDAAVVRTHSRLREKGIEP
jgi:hypothetical protein